MYAVFLLLLFVFMASFIARLTHASLFLRFLSAPTFIAFGFFLSPHGIGILNQTILNSLHLFFVTALSWLGLLLGLRRLVFKNTRVLTRKLMLTWQILFTWLITFIITLIFEFQFLPQNYLLNLMTYAFLAAILLGRTLLVFNSLRINSFHSALIAALATAIYSYVLNFTALNDAATSLKFFLIGVAVTFICNAIFYILSRKISLNLEIYVLILIAISILLAGIGLWLQVPIIVLSFLFGILISTYKKPLSPISRELFRSEPTVRIVLMTFIGATLQFSLPIIVYGILFGAFLSLARFLIHKLINTRQEIKRTFSIFMASSEICVPFSVALWISSIKFELYLNHLVVFIISASSISDILGVIGWWHIGKKRKAKRMLIAQKAGATK